MNYPTDSKEITEYLCRQWAKDFPEQNPRFPSYYLWQFRSLPTNFFARAKPDNMEKAERYLHELRNGTDFPPIVYFELFGEVINGIHRLWAYQQLGASKTKTIHKQSWGSYRVIGSLGFLLLYWLSLTPCI